MRISASILSADFSSLSKDITTVQDAGADWIHMDVMDGQFVTNLTFGAPVIKCLRSSCPNSFFDVHLMIVEPEKLLDDFLKAGADLITIHYESTRNIKEIILSVKSAGKKIGISIKPETNVDVLIPYLREIDLVLIMSVNPGFGGQKFMDSCLPKIKKLNSLRSQNPDTYKFLIEDDGGVNETTAKLLKEVGTDILVAGSYIFKSKSYKQAIDALRIA